MAVKDWLPVAQDIYDALIEDGNPNQGKTLKISHKDLCEILDKHSITVTEAMNRPISKIEETPYLVYAIGSTVQYKDLSKSLCDNNLFRGYLTDAEERFAKSSSNVPKTMWTYQIAHELHLAFKNPKAKEEAIKDDEEIEKAREEIIEDEIKVSEEKENTNEDMEFVETEESSEDSFESTKHDKIIKICSEIIEIRKKLGFVPMPDLAKIVGKEFFSNDTTSLFAVPGDKRYIKVLGILNNIFTIVNTLSKESGIEELVKRAEDQFDKLNEIAESAESFDEDKQFNLALEYLDNLKKLNNSKPICIYELLDAFVVGKIIDNESEYMFLTSTTTSALMMKLADLINAVNFDIKDKAQVDTCKSLLSTIKQTVLQNKTFRSNFVYGLNGCIDPKIYQKAAAFDKIVEALRPIFTELETEKPLMKGFDSPLNGWGSPFNMNPLFKV